MNHALLISIIPHNSAEFIVEAAKTAGAGGGSIIMGRGTASSNIVQLLGFGDKAQDIVYIVVENGKKQAILDAIKKASESKKEHFGVLFTIEVDDFIKSGHITESESTKNAATNFAKAKNHEESRNGGKKMNSSYQMINVIVNKGYAEDAMAAARKAGAGGGTTIGARGTAREDDVAFFGMKIVPEKEMLMILVPSEKKDEIVKAITAIPCFAEKGSGIIFCSEANDFTLLGK